MRSERIKRIGHVAAPTLTITYEQVVYETMKATPLGVILTAALLCGCSHSQKPKDFSELSPVERSANLRSQIPHAILEHCTNSIPAIHAIVTTSTDSDTDAIVKWRAFVILDYVNKAGGIERTNLHLIFNNNVFGNLYALDDAEYYHAQLLKEIADRDRAAGITPAAK